MTRSILRTAAAKSVASSKSVNRFVRFGYRRPTPWQLETISNHLEQSTQAAEPSESHSFRHSKTHFKEYAFLDHSTWPEIKDKTFPLIPVCTGQDPTIVPVLAHGIEVVLRGDGVYPLEAPWAATRQRRNFPHNRQSRLQRPQQSHSPTYYGDSLRKIIQPHEIAWQNIPEYIPAAQDFSLHELAGATPGVQYCSSTSSITPAISTLYHLLSNFRDTDLHGGLSSHVADLPTYFAKMHRKPIAFTVKRSNAKKKVYSVNAHSGPSTGPSILRDLGHSMERMLTTSPDEFFEKYVLPKEGPETFANDITCGTPNPSNNDEQFYNYSKVSKFLLRAQIDCRNEHTGEVFDVKTRAVAPIRYDLANYQAFTSHRLRFLRGKNDSYEREFYDMVRSVFLKYALQLRIGRMSGALVAYHNTSEILGLEYIPLKEIHSYVFGGERWADIAFGSAIHLMEEVLDTTTKTFCTDDSNEHLKVVMLAEWSRLQMYIFVQRLRDGEDDPFSPEVFLKTKRPTSVMSEDVDHHHPDLSGNGQWHVDSFLHDGSRGVSAVGLHSSIERLGGKLLQPQGDQASPQPAMKKPRTETYDYLSYDCSSLTKDRFRVWQLKVFPVVNDDLAPRNMIRLSENDTFTLKYNLKEVPEVKKEHLAKFVTSLGRIYMS